jgi:hypothetical protein
MKIVKPAAKIAAAITGLAMAASLAACDRSGISAGNPQIVYSEPGIVIPLPQGSDWWAEKWGFDNYLDHANLEDMVQIRNNAFIFGRDYSFEIYPGERNEDGFNVFADTPLQMSVPLQPEWFLSQVKFDSEDVDDAGGAEIILTEVRSAGFFSGYLVRNKVALYNGQNSYEVIGGQDLEGQVSDFIERCDNMIGEDDSLDDYLAIDWGDMDKDGRADQIFVCDYLNDAEILVVTSALEPGDAEMSYGQIYTGFIENFFLDRSVSDQDMEDYDYNQAYEIALFYNRGGNTIDVTIALNAGIRGSTIDFYVQPDYRITLPGGVSAGVLGLGTKKIDSFNADMSPYADIVYLGKSHGSQVMVVFPTYIIPLNP